MKLTMKAALMLGAVVVGAGSASAECGIEAGSVRILSNDFAAVNVVNAAAAECASDTVTVTSNATTEHKNIQGPALSVNPAEYTVAVVASNSIVPLLNDGLIRPLDDLVAQYGASLLPSQLISIDGQVMAVAFMANGQHLFVRKDINDVRDLAGKNIGITTPGSLPHVITATLMEKKGVDTSGVSWVNVGGSATAVQALAAGKVDAAAASFDTAPSVEKADAGKLLLFFRDELPEYFRGTIHFSDKLIKDSPDLVGNFMVAYGKGIRYALEHKDETLTLAEKITGQARADLVSGYDFTVNKKLIEPNALIDPAKLQFMQKLNVQFKLQNEVLPNERVATWEFQKKMISVIGEYKQ